MTDTVNKKDVLKVARLSNVILSEHEIPMFQGQLDAVLTYAARVNTVGVCVIEKEHVIDMNRNIARKDVVCKQNAEIVLSQVPVREGSLIIVPMILEGV